MSRRESRELLMQILFQMESQQDSSAYLMKQLLETRLEEKDFGKKNEKYVIDTFRIISSNIKKIDEIINENADKWNTSRMPKVDLAIARLAVGEILYCEEIPDAVTVNEAVEMVKKYSSEESFKFINGILGKIVKERNE